jgi:preprotein translocase subunit SecG
MVYYLITTLHVLVCFILILVVLLQSGKGADLAGAFGGGATQTAFGSRGPASFLSKMTTLAAIIFMVTSITLSTMTTKREGAKSILETTGATKAPAKAPAVNTAPAVPAPTPEQIRQKQLEAESKQAQPAQVQTAPAQGAGRGATPAQTPAKPITPPPAGKKP